MSVKVITRNLQSCPSVCVILSYKWDEGLDTLWFLWTSVHHTNFGLVVSGHVSYLTCRHDS